jgi:hypothetical protein
MADRVAFLDRAAIPDLFPAREARAGAERALGRLGPCRLSVEEPNPYLLGPHAAQEARDPEARQSGPVRCRLDLMERERSLVAEGVAYAHADILSLMSGAIRIDTAWRCGPTSFRDTVVRDLLDGAVQALAPAALGVEDRLALFLTLAALLDAAMTAYPSAWGPVTPDQAERAATGNHRSWAPVLEDSGRTCFAIKTHTDWGFWAFGEPWTLGKTVDRADGRVTHLDRVIRLDPKGGADPSWARKAFGTPNTV